MLLVRFIAGLQRCGILYSVQPDRVDCLKLKVGLVEILGRICTRQVVKRLLRPDVPHGLRNTQVQNPSMVTHNIQKIYSALKIEDDCLKYSRKLY